MPSPQCAPLAVLSPYTQATLSLAQSRPPSSVDVPSLRAQLDNLDTALSTLLDQRVRLSARLTEAVARSSPIRLLSAELLSAIFVASTVTSPSSPHDAPVLLSTLMLVCKHWRDICLCTPDLWCRISISPNEPDSLGKARRRLLRSKAVPLDIFLDFSPRSSFSAQASSTIHPHTQPLTPDHLLKTSLLLLRPTISRWRTFVLLIPYRPQATAALALCSSPAPMLESLTVQVSNPMLHLSSLEWDGDRIPGTRPVLPFGGVTPRLRECTLTSFWCERPDDIVSSPSPEPPGLEGNLALTPRNCGFPRFRLVPGLDTSIGGGARSRMVFPGVGPGLTKLRLVGFWNEFAPDVDEMLSVLQQCPVLEDLYLRNMSDVDPGEEELGVPAIRPIVLWRLRHLSFYYSGVTRACAMLHRTALPALERLELSYLDNITSCLKHLKQQAISRTAAYSYDYAYGYTDMSDTPELAQFPLKSLRIEASLFNELKLMQLFRRLPTLEKLELVDVEDVSSNLLKALSNPLQPHEWILPRLNTLNLEGCTSVEWDALKALVEGRLPSSSASSSAAAALRHRGSMSTSWPLGFVRSGVSSSASEYARGQAMAETPCAPASLPLANPRERSAGLPRKIGRLDLTRCNQISRERVQWLRMYVGDVVCDTAKGGWTGVDGV